MNMKSQVFAVVLSAVGLALWGCASTPPMTGDSTTPAPFDCTTNTCNVPTRNYMLGAIDVPQYIQVNAATTATVVTVTWTLHSLWGVAFNPAGGINMKDPKSPFTCNADNAKQWTCKGVGLQPRGQYEYGMKFVGTLRPYDIDPYIRN